MGDLYYIRPGHFSHQVVASKRFCKSPPGFSPKCHRETTRPP
jgi:hypothetical protein